MLLARVESVGPGWVQVESRAGPVGSDMVAWKDTSRRSPWRVRGMSVTGLVRSGSMVGPWRIWVRSGLGPGWVRGGSGQVRGGSGVDLERVQGGPGRVCGRSMTGIFLDLVS